LDIILEITKYLTLNDTVTAFSSDILYFLHKYKARLHLFEPSKVFMNMILQKIDAEQIVSLRFKAVYLGPKTALDYLSTSINIVSLTLLNIQSIEQFIEYHTIFSNLTFLSLWYDNEVDLDRLSNIFQHFRSRIKQFEVHNAGSLCTHDSSGQSNIEYIANTTIEYFLLDVGHFPLSSETIVRNVINHVF
jgi:hypothetical protein